MAGSKEFGHISGTRVVNTCLQGARCLTDILHNKATRSLYLKELYKKSWVWKQSL